MFAQRLSLVVFVLAVLCTCVLFSATLVHAITYNLNGRTYTLSNPTVSGRNLPLVLFFNGLNCPCASGDEMLRAAKGVGLNVLAGSVCAVKMSWDIGGNKDLDFTDDVIKDIASKFPIDKKKIFLTGFSMGGMHVSRYACARGTKVLGVSPNACALECAKPSTTVHWLGMQGTSDNVCPKWVDKAYAKLAASLKCPKSGNANGNADVIQKCNGKNVDIRHYPAGHQFLHPEVQMKIFKTILQDMSVKSAQDGNSTQVTGDEFITPTADESNQSTSTVMVAVGACLFVAGVVLAAVMLRLRRNKQNKQQADNHITHLEDTAALPPRPSVITTTL